MHYKKRKPHKLHSIPIGLCNNHKRSYLVSYSIPLSCVVALLLTGIFAINPSLSLKTSAVTIQDEWVVKENSSSSDSDSLVSENDNTSEGTDPVDDSFGGFGGDEAELSQEDMDAGIVPMSIVTAPTLAITVSNSNQTIDAVQGGNTVYGSYNVGITGSNVKDYTLSIKADAVNLVSPSQASTPTTVTGAGGKTGNSMTANTWGYKLAETSTAESSYGTLSYASLPTSLTQIANDTVASPYNLSASKKLVFAAKFSDTAAPGTYKGHITLSAVANQAVVGAIWSNDVESGITDMQDISSGFCKNNSRIVEGDTITLRDSRNTNSYTIVKLRDGKCWMQQDLRLEATADTGLILTSANTDIPDSWTLPKTVVGSGTSVPGWNNSNSEPRSATLSDNTTYGIYYNWCAATAGTCSSAEANADKIAAGSICPKGWHLPSGGGSGENGLGEFGVLNGLMENNNIVKVLRSPYFYNEAGSVYYGIVGSRDSIGMYWSSTVISDASAYQLYFRSANFFPGTDKADRYTGLPIRCVADY